MCFEYKNLTESWRRITDEKPQDLYCDKNSEGFQKPGWYRFNGKAGRHLATKPPGYEVCGTTKVGWMKGSHPTISDGVIKRMFCFHHKGGECQYEIESTVRTCPVDDEYTIFTKTFYVYYLKMPDLISCYSAFCAM